MLRHDTRARHSPPPGITGLGGGRVGSVVGGHSVTPGSLNDTP